MFDLVVRVHLEPEILRLFASSERAWPAESIALTVEGRYIPDGTAVAITVRSASAGPGAPVLWTGEGAFDNGRCVVEHRIDWDDAALADTFALGVADCQFCFDATVETYGLTATSPAFYVPFEPME